jgi:hypothetical protein
MKSFARLDRSMGNFRLWHLADIGVLANVRRHLRSFADQLFMEEAGQWPKRRPRLRLVLPQQRTSHWVTATYTLGQ